MATDVSKDLKEFYRFVGDKLTSGETDLSPEEALDEWRLLNPPPEELAESVSAIRRAVADMRAGDRGRPVEDVLAEIRQRLSTASKA
jgi:hypothetical protein